MRRTEIFLVHAVSCRDRRHYALAIGLPTASCSTFSSLKLLARQDPGDAALMHDRDAVGNADHLFHVGGDHQHRDAGIGQAAHQPVDLRLGADVDTARRLVEDHHLGRHGEPLAEHDLLLVAARQRAGPRRQPGRLDAEIAALRLGGLALRCVPRDQEALGMSAAGWAARCFPRSAGRAGCRRPCGLPARGRCRASTACEAWPRLEGLAGQLETAAIDRIDAEHRPRQFGAARADKPGKAEDLAAAQTSRLTGLAGIGRRCEHR